MIIDYVYKQLRDDNVCNSAYKFSKEYLGRSVSYYSVLKAQGREASCEVLLLLEMALLKKAERYTSNKYPYFVRTHNHLLEMHKTVKDYRERKILMDFITYKDE